jgi:hypothetical protein
VSNDSLDRDEVRRLGLDPEVIAEHQAKIRAQLRTGVGVTFPILESGRPDNQVVLRLRGPAAEALRSAGRAGLEAGELCTFVPAAGAASRYLKVFDALRAALASGAKTGIEACLAELRSLGDLSDLPFAVQPPHRPSDEELLRYGREVWDRYGALPKGLTPATLEGLTFFDLKLLERQALNPAGWMAVVVGEGMTGRFEEQLAHSLVPEELRRRVAFLVQGPPLSTLRFDPQAEPVRSSEGRYAPVVAGHGELLRLFPDVAALGPHRSVFIINIDNVIGTSPEVVAEMERFFGFFRAMLGLLDDLRAACRRRAVPPELAGRARSLGAAVGLPFEAAGGVELVLEIQRRLFHSGPEHVEAGDDPWAALERLCRRPLTAHGLVPNTGQDVGGIPAFIELDGRRVKICLEMPHATPADQTTYFRDPRKATHFNPVFAIHELCPHIPAAERTDRRFWMLTKKPYAGRDVYYHETVLYEAIGNSLTNNVAFVEIPRFLFNPHKVFTDCRGRSAASYGFEAPRTPGIS